MLALAQVGAEQLQQTDPYTNRTGNLRGGTQAVLVVNGATIVVDLEMAEDYASYVEALGYSNFGEVSSQVAKLMDRSMARVGTKLGR